MWALYNRCMLYLKNIYLLIKERLDGRKCYSMSEADAKTYTFCM